MSLILDASAAVAWAFADLSFKRAVPALTHVQKHDALVPALWQFEVPSALRKAIEDGRLSRPQAAAFLADLSTLDIRVMPPRSMGKLIDPAAQFQLSTYDASYLDLALEYRLPLATLDKDLARAARQAGVACFLDI